MNKRISIKKIFILKWIGGIVGLLIIFLLTGMQIKRHPRILIFSKTNGFHHTSIPAGISAIEKLGTENKFDTDTTTDANFFNSETLNKYKAVIFLSPTGSLFNDQQKEAFKNYIRSGHGFVGIHAASDAEYQWPWYGGLVGAYFNGHPKIQQALIQVVDTKDPSTKGLPPLWSRTDEWYNFKDLGKDLEVVLTIDEKSYQGGTNGAYHPMAWHHLYEGGRAFYTELGHTEASFSDPLYLGHLLGGIQYAMAGKGLR